MVKHIHIDRCDSTQDILKEQLSLDDSHEYIVSCENQMAGRGRSEKVWLDSPGTLCFSMTISPHPQPSFTALEISCLICRYFESKGVRLKLKWPNDILNHEEKKCAGILVQNSASRFIAGIGINLFYESVDFGGVYESSFEIDKKSSSLELAKFINGHRYDSSEDLSRDWMQRCFHAHKNVRVIEGENETTGTFEGLGKFGEAILKNSDGQHHLYNGSLRLV